MEKTFATTEPVTVELTWGSGTATVTATDTRESRVEIIGPDEVVAECTVELRDATLIVQAPRDSHRGLRIDDEGIYAFGLSIDDRGVYFRSSRDRQLDVRIEVPRSSGLNFTVGSTDVSALGEFEAVHGKSGSGDVRVERCSELQCRTGSGDLLVDSVQGRADIQSGSGDVNVREAGGQLVATSGSGDLLVDRANAGAECRSGSGDVLINTVRGDVSATTTSGDLTVRQVGAGKHQLRCVSGDVLVGVLAGLPVWTDVTTVSGDVASHLASMGEPEPGEPYVSLQASSISGDITLRQA